MGVVSIDYQYFFSLFCNLTQITVGLLGITGLLAVYRLEHQELLISNFRQILMRYNSILRVRHSDQPYDPEWYSYMDDSELVKLTDIAIKQHQRDVDVGKELEVSTMRVKTFITKLNNFESAKARKEKIGEKAKLLMSIQSLASVYFFINILNLSFYSTHIPLGYVNLTFSAFSFLFGIYFLVKFIFLCFMPVQKVVYAGVFLP